MTERCVKGDYIGFTFGGVHSSELGLMRVSNGSRYEQDLLPPLQDKTAQVNGRDGVVYFNSQYNTRPIKVPVAFDNMTEESFNRLKRLLQDKKPKYLWFDETPYKQWLVKAANVQNFKWICFDESKNIYRNDDGDSEDTKKRIYKGEGTLEFSCFTPYAESRVTFLDDPVDSIWIQDKEKSFKKLIKIETNDENNYNLTHNYNFEEWKTASKLRYKNDYNEDDMVKVYNAGDVPTNTFISVVTPKKENANNHIYNGGTFSLYNQADEEVKYIKIKSFELGYVDKILENGSREKQYDDGFIIDSKLKMIKGFKISEDGKSRIITNNIYNKYHIGGDYFKIPVCTDDEFYIIKSTSENEFTVDYKHYYI